MMMANPGVIRRPFHSRTLDWVTRCEKIDAWGYLDPFNWFITKGAIGGWLPHFDDIVVACADTAQASLEGLFGRVRHATCDFIGTIDHIPLWGFRRSEDAAAVQDSFIRLNLRPIDFPSVGDSQHAIGMYLTTNFLGTYHSFGVSGTAGLKSLTMRDCTGFRSYAFLNSDAILYGDASAWGFHLGIRYDAALAVVWRRQIKTEANAAIGGLLPDRSLVLLSTEPSVANSPNSLAMWFIGGAGITDQQAARLAVDCDDFFIDLDTYRDFAVPPIVLGPNAFGPDALAAIVPATMRVYRQLPFPATNTTPASATNAYPITDMMGRPYTQGSLTHILTADPVQTTAGSADLIITDARTPELLADDAVTIAGAQGGNGLAASDINGRRHLLEILGPTQFRVRAGQVANASGALGGVVITTGNQMFRPRQDQNFIPPRNGCAHAMVWSNRAPPGPDAVVTGAVNLRGNDSMAPITRQTTLSDLRAGLQCRPWYTTRQTAIGSTLATVAYHMGYAARNEPDDPRGWGYEDYLEQYGLDPAKALPWAHFWQHADQIFTRGQAGFAVCDDYVIWPMGKLADHPYAPARKRVWYDFEHRDFRPAAPTREMLIRSGEIAQAKGMKMSLLSHVLAGNRAAANGWTPDLANEIINHPGWETIDILAAWADTEFPDPIDMLDAQWAYLGGSTGALPFPANKVLVSGFLGAGKNRIDDPGPFAQKQMPIEQCERIANWMVAHGIVHFHTARAAATEGGEIERVVNQQLIAYLPNLAGEVPPVPDEPVPVANAWRDDVVSIGGTVSNLEYDGVLQLVDALMLQGLWPLIEHLGLYALATSIAASVDVRQRKLATLSGTTLPTFTPFAGFSTHGQTVGDSIRTGFMPRAHVIGAAADNFMMAMWQRVDVPIAGGFAAGAATQTAGSPVETTIRWQIKGGSGMGQQTSNICATAVGAEIDSGPDAQGLLATQRTGGGQHTWWHNGAQQGTPVLPTTLSAILPDGEIFIGTSGNTSGGASATVYRATDPAAFVVGQALTADQHVMLHNTLSTWVERMSLLATGGAPP